MPGTIQVSVLEFTVLQSSSSLSDMSLKISMGKREYQTWDKGDFSFPLTTLRDNLIVRVQDAEGRDVSHSVVETKLVIEKGIWDDLFPLEGGGHVHMKLQFILSEEDRHRIRLMRESALKKKHDELLNNEVRSPKNAGPRSTTTKTENFLKDKEETHSVKKPTDPNETDRNEDASSSSPVSSLGRLGSVLAAELQADAAINDQSNKQNPLEKAPGNIRNMISAFESSLNQDMRPRIRSASGKSQSSKTKVEHSSDNTELAQLSGVVRNPIHFRKREEKTDHLEELTTGHNQPKGTTVYLKNKSMHKFGIQEERSSSEDFERALTGEKASVSGRMHSEKHTHPLSNLFFWRRLSGEKSRKEIQANNLRLVNRQGASAAELYSSECYGGWIFPDGGKRLCITTGGRKMMDLIGDFHSETRNQPRKMTSPRAEKEKEVKEDGETSQIRRKSKTEDSTDAESSRGPVGQVMRIVIMVSFATLVFFTRQKKPR